MVLSSCQCNIRQILQSGTSLYHKAGERLRNGVVTAKQGGTQTEGASRSLTKKNLQTSPVSPISLFDASTNGGTYLQTGLMYNILKCPSERTNHFSIHSNRLANCGRLTFFQFEKNLPHAITEVGEVSQCFTFEISSLKVHILLLYQDSISLHPHVDFDFPLFAYTLSSSLVQTMY